jgi:hypothetical protein
MKEAGFIEEGLMSIVFFGGKYCDGDSSNTKNRLLKTRKD